MNRFIPVAVLTVIAISVAGTSVHAGQSIQDQWSASYDDGVMYVWSPYDVTIKHHYNQNFTTMQEGNWLMVTPVEHPRDFYINGSRTNLEQANHVPIIMWLEEEIKKVFKYAKTNTDNIADLQDKYAQLKSENKNLKKQISSLQGDIQELKSTIKQMQSQTGNIPP